MEILRYIKKLYNRIFASVLDLVKDHALMAVNITNNLKKVVDSPITDLITTIIPGDIDGKVARSLRKILPVVLEKITMALKLVEAGASKSEIIEVALTYLREGTKEQKTLFLISFAAELNVVLADGKITFSEAVILSQLIYKEMKK